MTRPLAAIGALVALLSIGCDQPQTFVVLDNQYPPAAAVLQVIDKAVWQAVSFSTPVLPAASSDPQMTTAASGNTAWVLLAPGWDPASSPRPSSLIVLQSRDGFAVHLDQTLHIPVDDDSFAGNCAAGSVLSQAEADFITGRVFASDFAGLVYDASTCTTTATGDPSGP